MSKRNAMSLVLGFVFAATLAQSAAAATPSEAMSVTSLANAKREAVTEVVKGRCTAFSSESRLAVKGKCFGFPGEKAVTIEFDEVGDPLNTTVRLADSNYTKMLRDMLTWLYGTPKALASDRKASVWTVGGERWTFMPVGGDWIFTREIEPRISDAEVSRFLRTFDLL